MTSIQSAREGYQRGVVLGLTLAEIMLILLFCLLLAAGVVLKRERDNYRKLESTLEDVASDRLPGQLVEALQSVRKGPLTDHSITVILEDLAGLELSTADKNSQEDLAREIGVVVKELVTTQSQRVSAKLPRLTSKEIVKIIRIGATANRIPDDWTKVARVQDALNRIVPADSNQEEFLKHLEEVFKSSNVRVQDLAASPGKFMIVVRNDPTPGEHDWPPIIRLSEADGYYFKLGSAELTPEFEQKLRDVVIPELVSIVEKFKVDVVEIVGHTDNVPLRAGLSSNLDSDLAAVLHGYASVEELVAADNAGLGFARAVAVVRLLKTDQRLAHYSILPLSAAQLTNTSEELSVGGEELNVRERRRVEVRVRRRSAHQ